MPAYSIDSWTSHVSAAVILWAGKWKDSGIGSLSKYCPSRTRLDGFIINFCGYQSLPNFLFHRFSTNTYISSSPCSQCPTTVTGPPGSVLRLSPLSAWQVSRYSSSACHSSPTLPRSDPPPWTSVCPGLFQTQKPHFEATRWSNKSVRIVAT